jgi:hypothetical protein
MRTALLLFSSLFFANFAHAQNEAAAQTAQAAQQAATEANQRAMQDATRASQEANDKMMQQMKDINDASQSAGPVIGLTAKPKISLRPGPQKAPIIVNLSDSTRGAILYYTTNGWTPTAASQRYIGPITIDSTTHLQVVAIAPYHIRSLVVSAVYTFSDSPASAEQALAAAPSDPNCIPVHLVFAQDVTSKTAEIGDKVLLTLADDLTLNGAVIAHKGEAATVTVTQVEKTGAGGDPGLRH